MNKLLDPNDIKSIAKLFDQEPELVDNSYSWTFKDSSNNNSIHFSIHTNVMLENSLTVLVSIQTIYGYYELHGIKKWQILPPDELFFFAECNNKISSLSISKNRGVSFFANVAKNIMHDDITELDPALVLSTIQLSLFK